MAQSAPIETLRLRILPFAQEHLTARYVGWLNDPVVVQFSEQRHRRHTLESCRSYWQSYTGTPHFFWAIIARDPALGHIGNINAYVSPENRMADVGILIGERAVWGQGYGLETWKAVCAYLLGEARLRKICAGTLASNSAMLAIMRRSGMIDDGRRARHYLVDSLEVDICHAAQFRDTKGTNAL